MGDRTKVTLGLGLGVLAVSSAASFVLLAAPLPPLVVAAGRVSITALLLAALGIRTWPRALRSLRERPALRRRVALAGALLALHFGTWIASLTLTTVLRSMALVALQPMFAGVLGRLLGDRVSPWLYVGAAVSCAGTWVLIGAGAEAGDGAQARLVGDLLALVGGAAAAAYLAAGRSVRDDLPLSNYLSLVNVTAAALLALAVVAFGVGIPAVHDGAWGAVVVLGVVPGVIGHGLFNWVVRKVPVHIVSFAVLLEPIGASLIAFVLLGRTVTMWEVVGTAIVLLGVAVGTRAPKT
ncbi:MAG: DMT family transporter [Myxococcota bacterium]